MKKIKLKFRNMLGNASDTVYEPEADKFTEKRVIQIKAV